MLLSNAVSSITSTDKILDHSCSYILSTLTVTVLLSRSFSAAKLALKACPCKLSVHETLHYACSTMAED